MLLLQPRAKDGPAKAVAWALQNRKSYKENKVRCSAVAVKGSFFFALKLINSWSVGCLWSFSYREISLATGGLAAATGEEPHGQQVVLNVRRITGPDENQKDFGYLRRMKMQDSA